METSSKFSLQKIRAKKPQPLLAPQNPARWQESPGAEIRLGGFRLKPLMSSTFVVLLGDHATPVRDCPWKTQRLNVFFYGWFPKGLVQRMEVCYGIAIINFHLIFITFVLPSS